MNKDGHLVTKVSNPLQINMEELHRYDLILLDIMMPGIDGFELCKRIRALVDCPILFLTAKTEENSLVNGLSLGADDYISKPFGVMELRARINAHLRREHRDVYKRQDKAVPQRAKRAARVDRDVLSHSIFGRRTRGGITDDFSTGRRKYKHNMRRV